MGMIRHGTASALLCFAPISTLPSLENITSKWAVRPVTIINSHVQHGEQLARKVQSVSTKRWVRIRPKHYQFIVMTSEALCR
jgi:hypothetical protein